MVEKLPCTHTYLLLGDAYINIQEVKEGGGRGLCVTWGFPVFLFFIGFEKETWSLFDPTTETLNFPKRHLLMQSVSCKHGLHG